MRPLVGNYRYVTANSAADVRPRAPGSPTRRNPTAPLSNPLWLLLHVLDQQGTAHPHICDGPAGASGDSHAFYGLGLSVTDPSAPMMTGMVSEHFV